MRFIPKNPIWKEYSFWPLLALVSDGLYCASGRDGVNTTLYKLSKERGERIRGYHDKPVSETTSGGA